MENPIQRDDLGVPPYAHFSWVLTGKCLAPVTGDRPAEISLGASARGFQPASKMGRKRGGASGFQNGSHSESDESGSVFDFD